MGRKRGSVQETRLTRVLLFAKAPDPGRVKTRLIPALSADGAAELAAQMLAFTLSEASAQMASIDWITQNGTATSGSDYAASQGTVVFMPGETD